MEPELNYQEILNTISRMIATAKGNVRQGSFYFFLWGWVVAICNFSHYFLLEFTSYEHPYIVWLLTIPTAVVSAVYGARQQRKAGFTTYYDRLYGRIWLAMGVSIVLVITFGARINFFINPVILLFAASGTFLSGNLLKFNPLIWGGIILWACSAITFFLSEPMHYLVGGVGIILGYIVPAYLLKARKDA